MGIHNRNSIGHTTSSVDEEEGFEDCLEDEQTHTSDANTADLVMQTPAPQRRHEQPLSFPNNEHQNNNGRVSHRSNTSEESGYRIDDNMDEADDNDTVSDKEFLGSFYSPQQSVGVIIAFGKEQLCTPPALLLLCPFTAMFVTFAFLDLENWNWRNCLVNRSVRRHCYGYQALGFSLILLIGLQFYGDRIVRESLGDDQQTVASRLFQRQLAALILTCGVGLFAIEDTLARETSIFATAFATFCIFTGTAHKAAGLPAVTWVPFLWNGAQLLLVAWLGGNLVDGKWTSEWEGNDSTGILDR